MFDKNLIDRQNMFCPNCGIELKIPDQKFCHNCGNHITIISKSPQLRPERAQFLTIPKSHPTLRYTYIPVSKPLPDNPYPNSRKCLGFGLASIAIAIQGLIVSGSILIFSLYIVAFMLCLAINVVGLIFGILSKQKSLKADRKEPDNAIQQFGNVLGIIGIIINVIAIALIFLIFPFLLLRS
ncbi:MAG: hypothetical protein ACFFDN_47435 [Candidatus Hodarchaeota archaeon]